MAELISEVPVLPPFGEPCELTDEDYERVLRRAGPTDGGQGAAVSAFSSSI